MAEDNAPAAAPAKKGRLKLVLLLVLVVILAIGLSVAGTMWFLGGSIPGLTGGDEKVETEQAEVFVPSTYTVLQKALVTTVQAEGRQRYAQAHLAFEADNPQALAAARQHMPLLRSRLIGVLGDRNFDELQTPEGRQALAADMLMAVNSALEQEGEPPLLRVLFRNFVVQ
ncbi:flagellar basal body-associated FliL family protein [Marinobacter orientalis]|uniref:Flagellar protein FliL n=1 Tax=Marinobacter orientalis TaxID=1928859 RepID=A0A7Y0WTH4_9GAMM|nr:flagellar basal body-associated FliL family protein [Marinobacter orientalis]NMT64720.1 flagellar basal body-associated FliL family protein [Marinobacter orientalis]TGX48246.1 flagellar basal body-associated FliL family protein [Marinobacter orientalis]